MMLVPILPALTIAGLTIGILATYYAMARTDKNRATTDQIVAGLLINSVPGPEGEVARAQ